MLQFFMPMIPPTVTDQEHRIGKTKNQKYYVYDTSKLKDARSKLTAYLGKHLPSAAFEGAIQLTVKWLFPTTANHKDGEWRITKPDTDNLQKMLKDCMTKVGFWKDDAQVCSEIIQKFWADIPGIYVRIEEI